jgi:hypothetical protein
MSLNMEGLGWNVKIKSGQSKSVYRPDKKNV